MLRRLIPRSLQSRLLLTYLLLLLIGVGGLIFWTGLQLQNAIIEQTEHDLELEALIMANALRDPLEKWLEGESYSGRPLATLIESYARSVSARVTLITPTFQVLMSSDESATPRVEHAHPEIVAALSKNEQHDIRLDERTYEERLFVAAPVLDEENRVTAVLQLSVPMLPLHKTIQQTWLNLLVVGGSILLATALASVVVARQVTGPLRDLTVVTENMATGHLDQPIPVEGPDEIQRLAQSFRHMADRVREMLARQQAFVADAAHELRSPLTSLRLRIEMLQRHHQHNPSLTARYLQQMEREIEHLRRMVNHLLFLSQMDRGEKGKRVPLDLAPLLYELTDEMGLLVRANDLDLSVEVPSHLPAVLANPDAMRMVIRNLLDNAIKYTPAGGQITLHATTHKGLVQISVSDTGPGIPAEHLLRIFDRFYRVDKGRARNQGGAGLGLALVRSIVEAHGGTIMVESVPGQGSTFTVSLPALKQGPSQPVSTADPELVSDAI